MTNPGRTTQLRADGLDVPRPDRFGPGDPAFEAAMSAHDEARARGEMGYLDPSTGLFVMTSGYHADRGHCCDRGCRHCPYEV